MANHENLIRAMGRAAIAGSPTDPVAALTLIITGHYTSTVTQGGTLVNCNEAGGNISFQVPSGMDAGEIMALCEEAIQFLTTECNQGADGNWRIKPTRRIKRLRVSFRKKNFGGSARSVFPGVMQ